MNIVFNYLNFKGLSFFQLCYLSLLSQCHSLLLCMSTFPSIFLSFSPSGSHFLVFLPSMLSVLLMPMPFSLTLHVPFYLYLIIPIWLSLPCLCFSTFFMCHSFYFICHVLSHLCLYLSISRALSIHFQGTFYPLLWLFLFLSMLLYIPFSASFYRFLSLFLSHSMPLSIPVYVRVSPFVYAMISPLICLPSFYPFNFTLFVHVAFYHFSCIFLCPSCPSFTCLSDFVSLSLPFCALFLLQLTLHFRYNVSLNAYWSLPRYVYVYLSQPLFLPIAIVCLFTSGFFQKFFGGIQLTFDAEFLIPEIAQMTFSLSFFIFGSTTIHTHTPLLHSKLSLSDLSLSISTSNHPYLSMNLSYI